MLTLSLLIYLAALSAADSYQGYVNVNFGTGTIIFCCVVKLLLLFGIVVEAFSGLSSQMSGTHLVSQSQ